MRLRQVLAQFGYDTKLRVREIRRNLRLLFKAPRVATLLFAYQRAIRKLAWREAHDHTMMLAQAAEHSGDRRLLQEIGHALIRFQEDEAGHRLLKMHRDLTTAPLPKPWSGEDLRGKTILIETVLTEKQGLAVGLNASNRIGSLAAVCGRCIVVCAERLVPLFKRTFPEIEVRISDERGYGGDVDFVIDAIDLAYYFSAHKSLLKSFPLKAEPSTARALRENYLAGRDKKLIGLSWNSSHRGKESPLIPAWRELLADERYLFVSLQYGDVAGDIAAFRAIAGERMIFDPSVDQMQDMDRFAGQLAALDAMVSISNTGAHLANAMNVPLILVRDDLFRRAWPVLGRTVEEFPRLTVIGKDGRSWERVISEVCAELPNTLRR